MLELAKLGPLGVGLALAILTYGLIRAEQTLPSQRKSLIRLYWGFMAFSLVIALSGFVFDRLSGSIRLVTDGERNRVFMAAWSLAYGQAETHNGNRKTGMDMIEGVLDNAGKSSAFSDGLLMEITKIRDQGESNLRPAQFECLRRWMLDELLATRATRFAAGDCVSAR